MHEMGIAREILSIVAEKLAEMDIKQQVESVRFIAGNTNQIVPDSLRFHFDAMKTEFDHFSNTHLEIEIRPLTGECKKCNKTVSVETPHFFCLDCGEPLQNIQNEEMRVESIEIEDICTDPAANN